MFYVSQLHAGHFYISATTRETQAGFRVPAAFDKAYATRKEAEAARLQAAASLQNAAADEAERDSYFAELDAAEAADVQAAAVVKGSR